MYSDIQAIIFKINKYFVNIKDMNSDKNFVRNKLGTESNLNGPLKAVVFLFINSSSNET